MTKCAGNDRITYYILEVLKKSNNPLLSFYRQLKFPSIQILYTLLTFGHGLAAGGPIYLIFYRNSLGFCILI